MLSTENQPDPLCSYKISGLKSDERASDHTLALEEQVDLLKSGPSDDKNLPSFSIRDYVSTSRKNGIEKNWPFPQQYLELCSKHGVRDMLPPFEPPDLIKNRSSGTSVQTCELVCTDGRKSIVDDNSREEGNTTSNFVRSNTYLPIDQPALDLSDQAQVLLQEQVNLAVDPSGKDTCKLFRLPSVQGNRKGVTSTVNNSGQSERENVSSNRFRRSRELGTSSSRTLREFEVVEARSALQKNRNTIESPSKKSKVIVNLDNLSNPSCCEDIGGSGTSVSEVMSSKVCPVCKTFLSTSNTTLNAHIDQCLAMESTSKWAGNVIFSKSKAKPRKKRLMVDIYATAPRCTLEELDRRNGSNWAADASLPASNTEACAEGRRQRFFQEFSEDNSDENAVYFDSNGKKLRILSKLDEASVLRVGDDVEPRKQANENKESDTCFPGKVRRLGLKDSNCLKVKTQKTKYYSSRPDRLEICEAPEGTCRLDEVFEKEESLSELLKARDHTNPGELRQWVCSKRTGLSKKFNIKDGRQRQGYPSLTKRDPLIDNDQSILGNSSLDTSCIRKLSDPLGNPNFSPRSRQIEKPSSYGVRISDKGERSEKPSESHFNRLNDGSTCSTHVRSMLKFSSSTRDHDSYLRSKRVEVRASLAENSNSVTRRVVSPSKTCQRMSSKGKKVSSSMKNLSLVGPSSPHFRSTNHAKCSTLKKSRTDGPTMKTVEQVRAMSSDMEEEYDQMHDSTACRSGSFNMIQGNRKSAGSRCEKVRDEVSVERNGLLDSGQRGETLRISGRVEPKALQSMKSGPQEAALSSKSSPTEPNVSTYVRSLVVRSAETSVSELHKQATPSNARSNCLQSIGEGDTSLACRTEAQISSSEQSFYNDQDTDFVEEVGICDKVGGNSIPEPEYTECGVEQISIPGPPGFFLPSPGEIGSDVHVENSSLTSNRLPSSLDQYFPADRDSSGSPVSATSTISHSQSSRADPKYVESTSYAGPRADLEKFVSSFTSGNTKQNIETEYKSYFDKESVRPSTISRDDHHCRCAWKEGVTWVSPSSYQDPQLLKQHSVAPMVIPTEGSQRNWALNEKIVPIVDSRSLASSKVLSPDAAPKFPGYDKFGSAGSSSSQACHPQPTTNPVLRLMGKNLMVVNSEKDASVEIKESQPICPTDVRNERYPTLQGFSIGNVSTNDCVSFYHMAPDGSVVFNRDPSNPSPVSSNHNNINFEDFMGSRLPQNGSRDRNDLQARQTVPIDRLNSQFTYHADRGAYAAPQPQQQYPYFSAQAAASSRREVIVIDDSQDNEAELSMKYSQGSKGKLPSPVGVLPSPTSGPNMRQVNSFYCYPSPNPYMPREPPPAIPYPIMYPRGTNSQVKQGDSLYAFTPKLR